MGVVEFIEKICGLELLEYQKQYLNNMERLWEQGKTLELVNGRVVAIPRKEVTDGRSKTF